MKRKVIITLVFSVLAVSCEPPPETQRFHLGEHDKNEGPQRERKRKEWLKEMKDLSKDYTTFPSSYDVTDSIDSYVSATQGCEQYYDSTNYTNKVHNPAAKGARLLLASMFQSCKALDNVIGPETKNLQGVTSAKKFRKPNSRSYQYGVSGGRLRKITNNEDYVNSHIVLKELAKDPDYPAKGCKSVLDQPPVYGYGSRTGVSKSGEVRLFKKGSGVARSSKPASGIDCSAFISTALGSQGLKVTTSSGPFVSNTTRSFSALTRQKNSCLKPATFEANDTIRPGDMLNVAGSHIVMIDGVGIDPLGINKRAKTNSCHDISVNDFDFTFIHSGALKNSYGPSRVHISTYAKKPGTMFSNLRQIALKACLNKVKGKKDVVSTANMSTNSRFSLIRHQSDNPSCRSDKRVKLEGEDCVKQCLGESEGQAT